MRRTYLLALVATLALGCSDPDAGNNSSNPDAGTTSDTSEATDTTADTRPTDVGDAQADSGDAGDTTTSNNNTPSEVSVSYLFADGAEGMQGWQAGITDYPKSQESRLDFVSEVKDQPPELDPERSAIFLEARNVSKDIFFFIKRQIGPEEGLVPNTKYELSWTIIFGSNAPEGCTAPKEPWGEGMHLKAGGSSVEPQKKETFDRTAFELNVDKGNHGVGGPAATVVSTMANGVPCDMNFEDFKKLEREHTHPDPIQTNSNGELWLFTGVDSEFDGELNAIYYLGISVTLTPQP